MFVAIPEGFVAKSLEDIAALFDQHATDTFKAVLQMQSAKGKSNMRARAQTWADAARALRSVIMCKDEKE